jgi:16S rRNA (uracil1498-N3)-methyltransferase
MRSTDADGAGSRPPVFTVGSAELAGDPIVVSGREGHHARTVRRLRPGERVDLTDGAGRVAECVVTAAVPAGLECAVRRRRAEPRPEPSVAVAQALPKGDRGELAVETMTEVGVDVVVPWAAERCVVRWPGERAERSLTRWRSAAVEAAKQSRRAWFPEVRALAGLDDVCALVAAAGLAVLLDPAAPVRLADLPVPAVGEIVLVVGPEGGVSAAEAGRLAAAGATRARLGPTVLRSSSAGAVAAALILSRTQRWA